VPGRAGVRVRGDEMRIIRVFPRRTTASPTDALAYFGPPDLFAEADEVHVSVAFTYDRPRAEELARQWEHVAPVRIGGPATGEAGGDFAPGMYLKPGYVITSRGCPNRCWFCSVWRREGREIRELPVTEGWNVLDDNLLACSEPHVRAVFAMLKRQSRRAEFTGGLEAARLADWHIDLLADLRPKQMFFAYDTPDDWEPLRDAGARLQEAGFTKAGHSLRAYVLIGFPNDTMEAADARLRQTWEAGFLPMAMLWRNTAGTVEREWRSFQRLWARPAMTACACGDGGGIRCYAGPTENAPATPATTSGGMANRSRRLT
jgi:hypothetical protein